jgi:ribosome-associated protein
VTAEGSLHVGPRTTIAVDEYEIRTTMSQGPGGQHVNRSATKVVVSFTVAGSSLSARQQHRLIAACGPVVRASASRERSQSRNKAAALEALAKKIEDGLYEAPLRRATKATRGSQERRLTAKRRDGAIKQQRQRRHDDE